MWSDKDGLQKILWVAFYLVILFFVKICGKIYDKIKVGVKH